MLRMRLGLMCATALLAPGVGLAQPGGGVPVGPVSNSTVTATGTTTARALNDRFAERLNILDYGVTSGAADNATNLQAAITAAIAAGKQLYIPSAPSGACYKYTPPLTIAGDLAIVGSNVGENWAGGINVPLGTQPLNGSVLCPVSNGSDAIDITGTSRHVDILNLGILFQTPFVGTGDGINYVPGSNVQGLSGSRWENVKVYGHDGNHYAYNLTNPIYDTLIAPFSYGGGGFNIAGNSTSGQYGNMVLIQPYTQVVVGGTSNGFTLTASQSAVLNLMTFIRPQSIIDNVSGVSPGGNLPTSAQLIWSADANVKTIRVIAPDWETNVAAGLTVGASGVGSDMDWAGYVGDTAFVNAPSWGTTGLTFGPISRTYTDTTGTGTVALQTMNSFPGTTLKATSPTTYTVLSTLYVSPPIQSTNVTATRLAAIYANGEIATTSDVTAQGGAFLSGGLVALNKNSNNAVEIADGTSNGLVTIGGASNTVGIRNLSATTIATATNCSSGASPAVCGSAAAGSAAVPTGASPTLQINTTAVTANSQIFLNEDESLGTKLGVTCNTSIATLTNPVVTARSAAASFTVQINATIAVNPACISWLIVN